MENTCLVSSQCGHDGWGGGGRAMSPAAFRAGLLVKRGRRPSGALLVYSVYGGENCYGLRKAEQMSDFINFLGVALHLI